MNIAALYRTILHSRESYIQKNSPECSLPKLYDTKRGFVRRRKVQPILIIKK